MVRICIRGTQYRKPRRTMHCEKRCDEEHSTASANTSRVCQVVDLQHISHCEQLCFVLCSYAVRPARSALVSTGLRFRITFPLASDRGRLEKRPSGARGTDPRADVASPGCAQHVWTVCALTCCTVLHGLGQPLGPRICHQHSPLARDRSCERPCRAVDRETCVRECAIAARGRPAAPE